MDAKSFRERAVAAFPVEGAPQEVVSALAREVHGDWFLLNDALNGRAWTSLAQSVLEERAKDIVALSLEAFVYFVPAFLCAAVANPEGDAATYAMYALCPLGSFDTFDAGTCALFSKPQAGVIADFLQFLNDEPSFELFTEEMKPGITLWRRRAL